MIGRRRRSKRDAAAADGRELEEAKGRHARLLADVKAMMPGLAVPVSTPGISDAFLRDEIRRVDEITIKRLMHEHIRDEKEGKS